VHSGVGLLREEAATVVLKVSPEDYLDPLSGEELDRRERNLSAWRKRLTRLTCQRNTVVEDILPRNGRDIASRPLLAGQEDEWLAMQAGMPLYPALFGRDTLTAGWQAAFLDRGDSLDASLMRLGRMQSDRGDAWDGAGPGGVPHPV